jgi:hypothetical protein
MHRILPRPPRIAKASPAAGGAAPGGLTVGAAANLALKARELCYIRRNGGLEK